MPLKLLTDLAHVPVESSAMPNHLIGQERKEKELHVIFPDGVFEAVFYKP